MSDTPAPLHDTYYLDNFNRLIHHTVTWYSDFLSSDEQEWLNRYQNLPVASQCLLVRLYSRKGHWFRSDKLNYPEIGEIQPQLDTLHCHNFIQLNPEISEQALASNLLTKPEITSLFPQLNKSLKKDALISELSTLDFDRHSELSFQTIYLESDYIINLLLALFFANTHQDLSQFVLADLGLNQFEDYSLSESNRFFSSREEVNQLLLLGELRSRYWEGDRKDIEVLNGLIEAMPETCKHAHLDRKRERLINDIARDYERLEAFTTAIELFNQTSLPPSRERRARIYDKQSAVELMESVVLDMLENPHDVEEHEIATRLRQTVMRRKGEKTKRKVAQTFEQIDLDLDLTQQRVELAVKQYLEEDGWQVYFSENTLLNGLFGLVYWKALFAPVNGAFINQYQYRPLDLYHSDFADKRHSLIEQATQRFIESKGQHLFGTFEAKQGIANPFVAWRVFSKELLADALTHIPIEDLVSLFKIQLSDLNIYRTGMPDLIAFKNGEYQWIEVKGPGDKLQNNQLRWIQNFTELGIPFKACFVTQSNKTKPI